MDLYSMHALSIVERLLYCFLIAAGFVVSSYLSSHFLKEIGYQNVQCCEINHIFLLSSFFISISFFTSVPWFMPLLAVNVLT